MKDVIIKIVASQTGDSPQDRDELAEFTTEGRYACDGGSGSISYQESELTGMEGTRTTIRFTPERAELSREGTVTSRMYFAPGKRNTFLYETPFGTATVGRAAQRYRPPLTEPRGELDMGYVVDFDHAFVGTNAMHITITEQRGQ